MGGHEKRNDTPMVMLQHRRAKLKLRVWNLNLLSHKGVGVALQVTVETLYEK